MSESASQSKARDWLDRNCGIYKLHVVRNLKKNRIHWVPESRLDNKVDVKAVRDSLDRICGHSECRGSQVKRAENVEVHVKKLCFPANKSMAQAQQKPGSKKKWKKKKRQMKLFVPWPDNFAATTTKSNILSRWLKDVQVANILHEH